MDEEYEGQVIADASQQLTMKFTKNYTIVLISAIYARFSAVETLEMQENMANIAEDLTDPWVVEETSMLYQRRKKSWEVQASLKMK